MILYLIGLRDRVLHAGRWLHVVWCSLVEGGGRVEDAVLKAVHTPGELPLRADHCVLILQAPLHYVLMLLTAAESTTNIHMKVTAKYTYTPRQKVGHT